MATTIQQTAWMCSKISFHYFPRPPSMSDLFITNCCFVACSHCTFWGSQVTPFIWLQSCIYLHISTVCMHSVGITIDPVLFTYTSTLKAIPQSFVYIDVPRIWSAISTNSIYQEMGWTPVFLGLDHQILPGFSWKSRFEETRLSKVYELCITIYIYMQLCTI